MVFLILALFSPAVRAEAEGPVEEFLRSLFETMAEHDFDAVIALIEKDPATARLAANALEADRLRQDEQGRRFSVFTANLIARVLKLRLNDPSLANELAARGILIPDSEWAGTPLAGAESPPGCEDAR
ncbi:hypothetical protein DYH09_21215 [bacterium CPR1]|nr:hypothetical protein [bacterium CPR1]